MKVSATQGTVEAGVGRQETGDRRKTRIAPILLMGTLLLVPLSSGRSRLPAGGTSPSTAALEPANVGGRSAFEQASTSSDQVDLSLTVYNSNIALVRDVRQLALPAGASELQFVDIAATVNPATVHFRSLSEPERLRVLEQNYEYDLLEPQKLLQKYVGRDVRLIRYRQQNGTTVSEEVTARLLAYNNGPVWQIGNEIVTGLGADHIRFPELPGNLYSRPTLLWSLDNRGDGRHRVETAYLAGDLSWSADYVLTVGRTQREADLDGWVTLVNNSGTAYENARLQLVAGDLHRVARALGRPELAAARQVAEAADMSRFAEEAFSEYHLYTLDRRTSVRDKETKQISLLTSSGASVLKRFVVDGSQVYYRNRHHPGAPIKDAVKVYFSFTNDKDSGLGLPMPAGTVRVYQADSNGNVQFVGEDLIDHTPQDERLDVHIGSAFDVVCERRQTDFSRLRDDLYEMEFEITLRNHKDEPISIEVNEPLGGDWEMLRSSHEWTKTDAWAARFMVPVAADGTSVLQYRVRVEY